MDTDRAIQLIQERQRELQALTSVSDARWHTWRQTTESILRRVLGDDHRLVSDFVDVNWTPYYSEDYPRYFQGAVRQSNGILDAAIFEIQELTAPAEVASDTAIDPDLWQHVAHLIEQEQWSQVASQTCIFVEDKMRQWAGLGPEAHSADLATKVLHPETGKFPLGVTRPEQDGWHQLGRGFVSAVRNVDGHRIQQRDDLKRYALGVVGTGSLLLTQLRFQHQNSFVKP